MFPEEAQEAHISIHAPREGGDVIDDFQGADSYISIHAPREGGDFYDHMEQVILLVFQSTPPARGATESQRERLPTF